MRLLLRGMTGVVVGVAYGLLVGAVMFLVTYEDRYTPYPGPLIPNRNEVARIVTTLAALIAGACGALVGLTAGVSGVGRAWAAALGFAFGLTVMLLLLGFDNPWPALIKGDRMAWRAVLTYLLLLPCGLALTGAAVSALAGLFRPHR